jgi:hypothetical protein
MQIIMSLFNTIAVTMDIYSDSFTVCIYKITRLMANELTKAFRKVKLKNLTHAVFNFFFLMTFILIFGYGLKFIKISSL